MAERDVKIGERIGRAHARGEGMTLTKREVVTLAGVISSGARDYKAIRAERDRFERRLAVVSSAVAREGLRVCVDSDPARLVPAGAPAPAVQ